jgi:hypothetical protein
MAYGPALPRLGCLALFVTLLAFSTVTRAQNAPDETKGVVSGDYTIQQSIEGGYRTTWINGNADTYDTFVDLGQGFRLFDYTLDMRSRDHNGFLFDDLSFSNFGYGGDPDDVSRLRLDKNKWYDFRAQFRRDRNFWDYNLLANPMNPAVSTPSIGIGTSPHNLDLVRRMQDYNLTLMPQSRVRLRLGVSHDRDQGPGSFTTDGGTIAQFNETFSYTTNAYHAGADFRLLPKTTISYDQFLTYFRQDKVIVDNPQNSGYTLANGTPVDPGIIWSSSGPVETLPCSPVATAPGVLNPACNGYLSYSQIGRPRNFMPTERLGFQSDYFDRFETSGSFGYSSANNSVPDFSEIVNDLVTRNGSRGSTAGGPADAKRVSVNANWSGAYSITEKARILDSFRYDNWRIPGVWNTAETNIVGQIQTPAVVGLNVPQALFTAATFLSICPAPYTAATCPNHTSSSSADFVNGFTNTFLGQNIRSNTIQFQYDITPRFTAQIGYMFTDRTIADFTATFLTAETYFPGGVVNPKKPPVDAFAARGDCANPAKCTETVDPTTGQLISLTFSGAAAGNDTARDLTGIIGHTALAGFTARPTDNLRITGDFEFGYNDYSFTRISPRQVQIYKVHANYKPRTWINLDGSIDIHENRDNVATVDDLEHGRSYSFVATLLPKSKVFYDVGYTYTGLYTQAQICYYDNAFGPPPATQCPALLGYNPPAVPGLGSYSSKQHFAYGDVTWKPAPRVTAVIGYSATFVGGDTLVIDPLQVPGSLAFNYQKPYVRAVFDLYKGLSYRMTWNYYGYNGKGQASNVIPGLAPIPIQDFNGSTTEFAFRYAF